MNAIAIRNLSKSFLFVMIPMLTPLLFMSWAAFPAAWCFGAICCQILKKTSLV